MALKKLIKGVRKTSVGKLAGKMAAVQAGVLTAGLVKPKALGIKNDQNQKIFRVTGNVTKVVGATVLAAGAGGVGPAAGLFGKAAAQGGGATSTGLAEKLKSFTEGGEIGTSPELVRNIQENDSELRSFEMPSFAASLAEMVQANLPLVLGGLALFAGAVFLWRRK